MAFKNDVADDMAPVEHPIWPLSGPRRAPRRAPRLAPLSGIPFSPLFVLATPVRPPPQHLDFQP
jgi:hypothetical protein